MKKTVIILAALAIAATAYAQPWHAKGDVYCVPGCWNFDAGNLLNDLGVSGDAVSGDGIYSALVTTDVGAIGKYSWKAARDDWSDAYPGSNQFVHVGVLAEQILFTLDTNANGDGWLPDQNIAWSDHYAPAGTAFEVIGAAAEIGTWADGVVATNVGGVHSVTVNIATLGSYDFLWRADNDWDLQTMRADGGASGGGNLNFTTVNPNTNVLFEFNANTGRTRSTVLTNTATENSSWGSMKQLFR